jgi:hypothetical protein
MTTGDRVVQLYPQALGTHFSRLLRHEWVTGDYSLIPATTRDSRSIMRSINLSMSVMYSFNVTQSVWQQVT